MQLSRRSFTTGLLGAAAVVAVPVPAAAPHSDIALLRRVYEALHPGLHRYLTPARAGTQFDRLEREWARTTTLSARYLALSRMLATLQCGHSYANFFNQSDTVQTTLFGGATRLPFHFRWIGERMIVIRDPSNTGIKPGTEILSIDRIGARETLAALMPYARADGSNDAKRRHLLGVAGGDGIESFDVYHGLAFPPRSGDVELVVASPGGASRTVRLARIDLAQRRAQMVANTQGDADAPAWTIDHRADGIAILTMAGWALYRSKWDWQGFLDTTFADMDRRGTRALIVDIRDNEGGLDCGHEIVARLIETPLTLAAYERRVRYVRVPDELRPHLDTWDKSFFDWGKDAVDPRGGFFRLRGEEGDGGTVIAPKGPRFRGRVLVLTDAGNSSATFQFADLIRTHRLGTLVGQTTGGNQRGINGGAFFFLRLPESGLEADVPLVGTFPRMPRPDAGITPDVPVEPVAADIATGRDPVLDRALALARA